MNNIEVVSNLFESHLSTISIILGIVAFLFSLLGLFSFFQIKKYIINEIKLSVQENISNILNNKELEAMIEKEINEKISEYGIIVKEVLQDDVKEGQL
jgi:hypothetical protein